MNYAAIKKFDIANGPGIRVSLFVSGCRHKCKGCFNKEAWSFKSGQKYTDDITKDLIESADGEHISGLSLLGGEPFEPENRVELAKVAKQFKEKYPDKTIWCYTGFVLDSELLSKTGKDEKEILDFLKNIDVLVDGRFEQEKKSPALLFRGSSNQRIIDVKQTLSQKRVVLLEGKWERKMGSGNINE